MTLYLKYRPQTIDELDLTSVRESLKKVLTAKNIPHAFLFSGPRGAGKTSAARIVAKALNCTNLQNGEPCNQCDQCKSINAGNHVDIIEMDAASNRGIDDIRALRESVVLSPQRATKKVYIVDEAHMLTTEAANAFLKTLEEPPSHVQFIFATTDPQKLPQTVLSRLYTVQFTKATPEEIARQLSRVISGEKIDIEDGVVSLIADSVDGSFRDAVKKLESMTLESEKITVSFAKEFLFNSNALDAYTLLGTIVQKQAKESLESIQSYADNGGDIKLLLEKLIDTLRKHIVGSFGVGSQDSAINLTVDEAIALVELFIEARGKLGKVHISSLPLELVVAQWCSNGTGKKEEKSRPIEKKPQIQTTQRSEPEKKEVSVADLLNQKIDAMKSVKIETTDVVVTGGDATQVWPRILAKAKQTNIAMEALLRAAEVIEYTDNTLKLGVHYQFHKESLESAKNRDLLDMIVKEVCGPVKVSFALTQPKAHAVADILTDANDADIIDAAKEIFGE